MIREIKEKTWHSRSAYHLAGIIPLCGQQYRDKKLPWHPALLPLAEDVLLIDAAILQCANAGCSTIWLVVDEYLEQYFRDRIGEYIEDPAYFGKNKYDPNAVVSRNKRIAIYYVPESFGDRDKRDSVSFQVFRGIEMARKITGQISTFIIPDKYFVTFPYGVSSIYETRKDRVELRRHNEHIYHFEDKSIKTGHYVPFTITYAAAKMCKKHVWEVSTGTTDPSQPKEEWKYGKFPTKMLPTADQYSGRWFGPDEVFRPFHEREDIVEMPLTWFYDVSTFDAYRKCLGTDKVFYPITKQIFRRKTWNSMSYDDDEFGEEE